MLKKIIPLLTAMAVASCSSDAPKSTTLEPAEHLGHTTQAAVGSWSAQSNSAFLGTVDLTNTDNAANILGNSSALSIAQYWVNVGSLGSDGVLSSPPDVSTVQAFLSTWSSAGTNADVYAWINADFGDTVDLTDTAVQTAISQDSRTLTPLMTARPTRRTAATLSTSARAHGKTGPSTAATGLA